MEELQMFLGLVGYNELHTLVLGSNKAANVAVEGGSALDVEY